MARWGELIARDEEALARLITMENGKTLQESKSEVKEAFDFARFMSAQARLIEGSTFPSQHERRLLMTLRQPVGVTALITPWNFPILIPCWKLFPALICGNTVILKPAEECPLAAHRLVELAAEAGLAPGVVNLIHGSGEGTGRTLVKHPGVALVSFTGSTETGRRIAQECALSLKRHVLELGGKNAQIVLADADLTEAVEGAVVGAYKTTGQRCTATSRIIVEQTVAGSFSERFLERTKQIRVGNGLDANVDMGPLVSESRRKRVHAYVEAGRREGAHLLLGGYFYESEPLAQGAFYPPTVFDSVKPGMAIAREEIFGPVICLMEAEDLEAALLDLNNNPYGLSASVYTSNMHTALEAVERIEAGLVYINSPTTGSELHMPFGGVKATGDGHREAGRYGLNIFSEWKSAYINYGRRVSRVELQTPA